MYDGTLEPAHAHTWCVRACFASQGLDRIGVVVDFTYVREQLTRIVEKIAGTSLNEWPVLQGASPSAEHVAAAFFRVLSGDPRLAPTLCGVYVREAPGCEAGYVPEGFPPGLMDRPIIDDKALED